MEMEKQKVLKVRILVVAIMVLLFVITIITSVKAGEIEVRDYELGAVFGLPSGINFVFGKHFGSAVIHISGLSGGAQITAAWKVSEKKKKYHAVGFGVGYQNLISGKDEERTDYKYAGAVYQYRSDGGLFIEVGPAIMFDNKGPITEAEKRTGIKEIKDRSLAPWMFLQLGYSWR